MSSAGPKCILRSRTRYCGGGGGAGTWPTWLRLASEVGRRCLRALPSKASPSEALPDKAVPDVARRNVVRLRVRGAKFGGGPAQIRSVGDFRKLVARQEAKRLAVLSQDAISTLPRAESFALGAQWRRAVYSVSLNIAEGATQSSSRQFRRYLEIAKASLAEFLGVLELAQALGYVSGTRLNELREVRTHCARLVTALARSIS